MSHSRHSEERILSPEVSSIELLRNVYQHFRFDPHFDPEKHNVWLKRYQLSKLEVFCYFFSFKTELSWSVSSERYVQATVKKELNELEEWTRVQEMKRKRSSIHFVPFSWRLCILESVIIGNDDRWQAHPNIFLCQGPCYPSSLLPSYWWRYSSKKICDTESWRQM